MRIATLNIRQGGGTRVPAILQFITRLNADVLVLTEFRAGPKGAEIRDSLRACGYEFQTPQVPQFARKIRRFFCGRVQWSQ